MIGDDRTERRRSANAAKSSTDNGVAGRNILTGGSTQRNCRRGLKRDCQRLQDAAGWDKNSRTLRVESNECLVSQESELSYGSRAEIRRSGIGRRVMFVSETFEMIAAET